MEDIAKRVEALGPEHVGRFLAHTYVLRAIVRMLAETTESDLSTVQTKLRESIHRDFALDRMHAAKAPELQSAMLMFDRALNLIFKDADKPGAAN